MAHHDLYCSTDVLNGFTRNCCTAFPPRKCTFSPACRFEDWMGHPQELCNACDQRASYPDMAGAISAPIPRCHQHTALEHQHCLCGCANACWNRRIGSETGDTSLPTQNSGHSDQRQFLRNSSSIRSTFMPPVQMARICPGASDPTREVDVYGWYLTRVPGRGSSSESEMDPSVAIGGYKSPQRVPEGLVQSGRVELRLESRKVRTVHGMTVCLKGMINLGKSVENGFPLTLVKYFIMGFPTAWIYMMMSLPTMTNCGRAIRYPWMSELGAPSDAASPSHCQFQDSFSGEQGPAGETTISVNEATGPDDLPKPNQGSCEALLRTDHTGAASALDEDSLDLNTNAGEMPPDTTIGSQCPLHASQSEDLTSAFVAHESGEELHHRTSPESSGCSSRSSIRSGVQNIGTSECNSQIPSVGISIDSHGFGDAAATGEHGGMTPQQAQTSDAHVTFIETRVEVASSMENATPPTEVHVTHYVTEAIGPADAGGNSKDVGSLAENPVTSSHSPEETAPLSTPQNASPVSVGGLDQGSEVVKASDKVPEDDKAPSDMNLDPVDGGIPPIDAEGQMVLESKDESQVAREEPAVTDHLVSPDPICELLDSDEGMHSTSPSITASGAEPVPSFEVTGKSMKRRCRKLSFAGSLGKTRAVVPDRSQGRKTRLMTSKSKQSSVAAEDGIALKDSQVTMEGMQVAVEEEDQNHSQGLVPCTPLPNSRKRKAGGNSPGEVHTSATVTEKDSSETLRKSGEGRTLRSGRRLPILNEPDAAMSGGNRNAEQDIKESEDATHSSAGTQPDPVAAERLVNIHATVAANSQFAADCRHNSTDGNAEAAKVDPNVECSTSDVQSPNDAERCNETNLAGSSQIKKRRRKGHQFYKRRKRRSCVKNSSGPDPSVVCEDPFHHTPAARDVDSNEANITFQPRESGEQAEASIVQPTRKTVAEDDAQTEALCRPLVQTKTRKEKKSRKCWQVLQDEAPRRKRDSHRSGSGLKEQKNQSAKVKETIRNFMIPPPLPTPLVLDKSQVTQAYGLKKSRHGRILVPPLAVWCNQSIKYDLDGSLIAIYPGTRSESEYSTVSYDLPSDKRAKMLQKKFQRAADIVWSRK